MKPGMLDDSALDETNLLDITEIDDPRDREFSMAVIETKASTSRVST
jgi:hypothetical protein